MNLPVLIGLIISIALFGYLAYAIARPEKF
jgi:K+-transporting ATPase KdpF subunit